MGRHFNRRQSGGLCQLDSGVKDDPNLAGTEARPTLIFSIQYPESIIENPASSTLVLLHLMSIFPKQIDHAVRADQVTGAYDNQNIFVFLHERFNS